MEIEYDEIKKEEPFFPEESEYSYSSTASFSSVWVKEEDDSNDSCSILEHVQKVSIFN